MFIQEIWYKIILFLYLRTRIPHGIPSRPSVGEDVKRFRVVRKPQPRFGVTDPLTARVSAWHGGWGRLLFPQVFIKGVAVRWQLTLQRKQALTGCQRAQRLEIKWKREFLDLWRWRYLPLSGTSVVCAFPLQEGMSFRSARIFLEGCAGKSRA